MRKIFGLIVCLTWVTAACGGKGASPTAPSASTPAASSSAATISGSVVGAGASSLTADSIGSAMSGVTVAVVGTSISSTVDAAGRFMLPDVPPGSVQLRISGPGADATVSLQVQATERVEVVLVVSGSAVNVDSELHATESQAELEGRVESLPPTTPASTFKAAGRSVKTDSSTQFVQGSQTRSFGDLQIGMRVHARGRMSGDTFTATLVEMQNTNTAVPVEVNGTVDSLAGSASGFEFRIGSRVIRGNASTTLTGKGEAPTPFNALKNGVRVEVKGEQRDGFVFATRIHINDDADENENENENDDHDNGDKHDDQNEVELEGALGALGGGCPSIHFTVSATPVVANGSTKFDGVACLSLKNGDKVEVNGTKKDGTVTATRIRKK